jgi:hypothetical protein
MTVKRRGLDVMISQCADLHSTLATTLTHATILAATLQYVDLHTVIHADLLTVIPADPYVTLADLYATPAAILADPFADLALLAYPLQMNTNLSRASTTSLERSVT